MPFLHQQPPSNFYQPTTAGVRPCAWALLAIILSGLFAQQSLAISGDHVIVPSTRKGPTYSTQSGLQVSVDSTWVGNRGYRPLRVTASMVKPALADTLITISFHAGNWNWRNTSRSITVEADFELPQGATSVTSTFSVPQYGEWHAVGWELWVDGVKDEELCSSDRTYNSGGDAMAAGLFFPSVGTANPAELLRAVTNNSIEEHRLGLGNIPAHWIDYSPLDVVATTVESLEFAQGTSPEKLEELLRWVRAGGNLWVMDVGQDFSKLPKLNKLLTSEDEFEQVKIDSMGSPMSRWRFLELGETGRTRLNALVRLSMEEPQEETAISSAEMEDRTDPEIAVDTRSWFVARSYGLGTVVAIQNNVEKQWNTSLSQEFRGSGITLALQRSSLTENLNWGTRHGNDPAGGNPNFNHLLIPDVGTAPVFEFQLLISLFVIGIGPVNYWLLKRRNQLPLLLVTVPVAALAATLVLFTYGFLADGVGVRVRVRSMTMLDQRAGEVASWARMSYYAGIAPSGGLEMPADTTLYPILPARSDRNSFGRRQVNQQRSLEWSDQQRLTRGWLGSRTPTQYLAITARPSKKQLQFKTQPDQLTVTNQLGTEVLALIVQDHEGNIFAADQIDAEGTAILSPSTYIKGASKLRKLLAENLPQLPPGYTESRSSSRNLYGRGYGGDSGVPMSDSLMELHFEAIVSPVAIGWGNGTYVAVTATGIEVPLGVEGATETSSFHVVRGTW